LGIWKLHCNVRLQNVSVTLTLEVRTWFVDTTHKFEVEDVCQAFLKSLNAKLTLPI
jgi:hypothetical protein